MHFREVNKQLNQLKADVCWAEKSLNGVPWYDAAYNALVRDYQQALDALYRFRNTTISQLEG